MKPTLIVQAPIFTLSGYAERSLDLVRSIIRLDRFDVGLAPMPWGATPFLEPPADLAPLVIQGKVPRPDVFVQVTIPTEFRPLGRYNIGVTAGIEVDKVRPDWIQGANAMDLLLVSAEFGRKQFADAVYRGQDGSYLKLVKPVEIQFEGVDPVFASNPNRAGIRKLLADIPERFLFLYSGHWLGGHFTHDRKDVGGLIATFIQVFDDARPFKPALLLKCSQGAPSEMDRAEILDRIDQLQAKAKNPPNVYLLSGEMDRAEIATLYHNPKVRAMVSFTKGEGFGRPLAEFAFTGKPVFAPFFGGQRDFLAGYAQELAGELKPVHPSAGVGQWVPDGAKWLYVDYQKAGDAMGRFWKDANEGRLADWTPTAEAAAKVRADFSLAAMDQRVRDIFDRYVPASVQVDALELPPGMLADEAADLPNLNQEG